MEEKQATYQEFFNSLKRGDIYKVIDSKRYKHYIYIFISWRIDDFDNSLLITRMEIRTLMKAYCPRIKTINYGRPSDLNHDYYAL